MSFEDLPKPSILQNEIAKNPNGVQLFLKRHGFGDKNPLCQSLLHKCNVSIPSRQLLAGTEDGEFKLIGQTAISDLSVTVRVLVGVEDTRERILWWP